MARLPDHSCTLSIRENLLESASTSYYFSVATVLIFSSIFRVYISTGSGNVDLTISKFFFMSAFVSRKLEHAAWMWSQKLTNMQDVISSTAFMKTSEIFGQID